MITFCCNSCGNCFQDGLEYLGISALCPYCGSIDCKPWLKGMTKPLTVNHGKANKHAAIIKAWADGATIEVQQPASLKWVVDTNPEWVAHYNYRVRPAPPNYGAIAQAAWYRHGGCRPDRWQDVAQAVIRAYEKEKAHS